jgi:hypothetical protein
MGTYSLLDAVAQVTRVLRDVGTTDAEREVPDLDMQALLRQAASVYGKHRPREVVVDLVADGTHFTPLPLDFDESTGTLLRCECPLEFERDPREWSLYRAPAGLTIRWLEGHEPSTGDAVRIAYHAARAWGDTALNTTILDGDFYAVCDLGVALCCSTIAQKYARTHEPLVNADVVGYRTKSQEWDGRAKSYRAAYENAMGLKDGVVAAGGWVNWDSTFSTGIDWMTHRRWGR